MVLRQTWIIIGIAVIAMAILLLIPQTKAARLLGVLSVLGIVIGAYSFYQSSLTQERQLDLEETARNNQYFTGIIAQFRDPAFKDDFEAIYGDDIPPNEYVLLTYISQAIENLNIQFDFTNPRDRGDPVWLNVMRRWVQHPLFPLYWEQNADQYDVETRDLVALLLTGQI